ncbi:IFT172, partial [Symbiodinium pilosum]
VNRLIQDHAAEVGGDGSNYYMAQAKMAMLAKQFQRAEAILLDHNELDEALAMYQELHKYNESIQLAERKNHPKLVHLKNYYLQWLLSTQQEEKAGELQEIDGDYVRAIELYLRGGMAAKAASVVQRHNANYSQELLQKIVAGLQASGMHDRAGGLYERMGLIQPAMDAYRRGHAYRQAIELAKHSQPGLVVALEEEWGDWLVSQRQVDAAINHYIEAGNATKAIDAAMTARQWHKAETLLDQASMGADQTFALPFYEKLATHYAHSRQPETRIVEMLQNLQSAATLLNSTVDDTLGCISGCPMDSSTLNPRPLCVLSNCTTDLAKCLFSSTCRSGVMCELRCTESIAKTEDALHFSSMMECMRVHCPGFPPSKTCAALHCIKEAGECALHTKCRETLECANGCVPSKYSAALEAVQQSAQLQV